MEDKNGEREEYKCPGADFDIPLVVLVNGYSASASEILAGAIQDAGIGKLIGTQTYGKGIVQNLYPLGDGSAFKITIADYYTRNGRNIHKVGIEPDVTVEFDSEAYDKDETDNQLEKAKEIVLGKE
jgi:carboxyl-terminal processing protease